MDAAEPLLVQKDAGAVGAVIEMVLPPPERAGAAEGLCALQGRVVLPPLRLDTGAFRIGDADEILAAAFSAAVAVPILQNGQ
jgi:hypothetical protein